MSNRILHVAVGCKDLEEAEGFYAGVMGCRVARHYEDRVTFDFFGAQLVCHLSPGDAPAKVEMYPRHFGVTFVDEAEFDGVLARARGRAEFFAPPFVRFAGKREEHRSFFLKDPSNNLIEFKWYRDPEMAY